MRMLFLAVLACWSFAQTKDAQTQKQEDQVHLEQMTVSLREIRLHVFDEKGTPFSGLKSEDLLLKVNGKEQAISFFAESRRDPVPIAKESEKEAKKGAFLNSDDRENAVEATENPTHFWLIMLDSAALTSVGFKALQAQARYFVETKLAPNDLVRIVSLDYSYKILCPFTNNREKLLKAIDSAEFEGRLRKDLDWRSANIVSQLDRLENEYKAEFIRPYLPQSVSDPIARGVFQEVEAKERLKAGHFFTYYENMRIELASLARLDGPKTFLMFTGGLYLESIGSYKNTQKLADSLAANMNQANVTYYAIQIQELDATGSRHMNTSTYNMDEGEIFNLLAISGEDPVALNRLRGPLPQNTLMENMVHQLTGANNQSELTGGFVEVTRSGVLGNAVDIVAMKLSHYYRVGFVPPEKGGELKLSLALRDSRNLKLVYGKQMSDKLLTEPDEADEDGLNLLFNNSFRNDLEIRTEARLVPRNKSYLLPISLGLLEGQQKGNEWVVGFAALDAQRGKLDSTLSTVKFEPIRDTIYFHDLLVVTEVPTYLRFYLKEKKSGTLSLVEIPFDKEELVAFESLGPLVFERAGAKVLPLHYQRVGAAPNRPGVVELSDSERLSQDPFFDDSQVVVPYDEAAFLRDSKLPIWLRLPDKKPEAWQFEAEIQGKGEPVSMAVKVLRMRVQDDSSYLRLLLSGRMPPGAVRLVVTGRSGERTLRAEAGLRIFRDKSDVSPQELDNYLISIAPEAGQYSADAQKAVEAGGNLACVDENGNGLMLYGVSGQRADAVEALLKLGVAPDIANKGGTTAAMLAARLGFADGLAKLLDAGANAEAKDVLANGLWHYAAMDESGAAARMLLSRAVKGSEPNQMGHLPITMAAELGNAGFLAALKEAGSKLDAHDGDGNDLIHLAATAEKEDAFRFLLDAKAGLETRDRQGFTPLHLLARVGQVERIRLLLDKGAKLEAKSETEETPFLVAAAAGQVEAARELLQRGADRKAKFNGLDALMLAAFSGKLEMVRFLLSERYSPNAKSKQGLTALDYAKQGNHAAVVNLLSGEKSDFDWWDTK